MSLRHKEPGAVCKHKGDRGRLRSCGNELHCHPRSIAKYLLPKTERLQKRTFPTGKSRPASQCTQCHSSGRKLFQGSKCVSRWAWPRPRDPNAQNSGRRPSPFVFFHPPSSSLDSVLGHPSKAIKESLSKPQTKPSECAQLTHRDTRAATNLSISPLPGTLQSGKNPDFWNLLPQYAARCFMTPRDEKTNLRPPSKNCSPRCMFLYSVLQKSTRIP